MESRPFPRADTAAAAASAVPEVYEASDDAKSNIYNVIPHDRRRDLQLIESVHVPRLRECFRQVDTEVSGKQQQNSPNLETAI